MESAITEFAVSIQVAHCKRTSRNLAKHGFEKSIPVAKHDSADKAGDGYVRFAITVEIRHRESPKRVGVAWENHRSTEGAIAIAQQDAHGASGVAGCDDVGNTIPVQIRYGEGVDVVAGVERSRGREKAISVTQHHRNVASGTHDEIHLTIAIHVRSNDISDTNVVGR